MISTHEIFRLGNQDPILFEVNWNPDDPTTNECKVVRVVHQKDGGIKATTYINRENLHAFLFAIGTEEQQQKLIPQSQITKRRFEGLVKLTAKKNIAKGEEIIARCYHDLPEQFMESIGPIKSPAGPIITPKG